MQPQKHIARISGMNIKGRSFDHKLAPLTAIVGENATGKTAITDAIMIAVLGYHPSLGRKAGATMVIAPDSATKMECEAQFSTGETVRRSFTRTRTGAGLETTGTAPVTADAQLAFSDFLSAKPTERHSILNSLMAAIDYDAVNDRASAYVAANGVKFAFARLGDASPIQAMIGSIADQAKAIRQSVDLARKTIATLSATATLPSPIAANLIAAAEKRLSDATTEVGRTAGTLDALSDRIQRAPEQPDCDRPTDSEMQDVNDKLTAAETALATASGQNQYRRETLASIGAAQTLMNSLRGLAATAPPIKPEMTFEQADSALDQAREVYNQATEAAVQWSAEKARTAEADRTLHRQIAELRQHGKCPCCGTTGNALEQAMQAMLERAVTTADEAEAAIQKTQENTDEILRASNAIGAAKATLALAKGWEAKEKYDAVERAANAAQKTLAELPDVDALTKEEQVARAEFAAAVAARNAWRDCDQYELPKPSEVEKATKEYQGAKETKEAATLAVNELRQKRAEYDQALAEQTRINEMTTQADRDEADREKLLGFREFLIGEQREATAQAMKPLLKVAGVFLKGIIQGQMAIRDHQVGIQRGDQFIPVEILSGMEMIAVATACQAALATSAELPIVIIDEMARMTPKNRAKFSENCREAIEEGIVSQVILIDQTAEAHENALVIDCH